ncbi:MAG: hypothetical protein ACLTDM_07200 [Clostridium butyricum]
MYCSKENVLALLNNKIRYIEEIRELSNDTSIYNEFTRQIDVLKSVIIQIEYAFEK